MSKLQQGDWGDWPMSPRGWPKLICLPVEADRLIAAGLVTEDDIIRIKKIPTRPSK